MQSLYLKNQSIHFREIPAPVPKSGEALVKVSIAGICNTDLELVKGYMDFEGVLGHEFVGVVAECQTPEWLGKRVCGEINFGCNDCEFCHRGLQRHCPYRTVLGILNQNGAFAEYVIIPIENLRHLPDSVADNTAVFVEPLAAAFEILEQVRIRPDDRVAVIGDGKLGLLICQVLALTGCRLTLVGKHESKLSIARSWGIAAVDINEISSGKFDVVVEASGAAAGFSTAMDLVRPRGILVLKSTYAESLTLNAAPIVINEITIVGSRCGVFGPAIRSLAQGQIKVDAMIEKVLPFRQAMAAFELAARPGILKVLMKFDD